MGVRVSIMIIALLVGHDDKIGPKMIFQQDNFWHNALTHFALQSNPFHFCWNAVIFRLKILFCKKFSYFVNIWNYFHLYHIYMIHETFLDFYPKVVDLYLFRGIILRRVPLRCHSYDITKRPYSKWFHIFVYKIRWLKSGYNLIGCWCASQRIFLRWVKSK